MPRRIDVTRSLVPPLEDYVRQLERIWEDARFTNDGPLVKELESRLAAALEVPHGIAVANGTLALQVGCAALGLEGEVITTPLSFVGAASFLVWMGLEPVFADVDPETLTLDPKRCEEKITPRTSAILATHLYGFPCATDALETLARERGLKLIYDASHAFGCRWRGRPLAAHGDVSAMSLHATKLMHTAEGGILCTRDAELAHRCRVRRNFGFAGLEPVKVPGINAKLSELHAALGLAVLPRVDGAIGRRRRVFETYCEGLAPVSEQVRLPRIPEEFDYNYAFYPVVLPTAEAFVRAWSALVEQEVFARRYFHPALSRLPFAAGHPAPVAEELSGRLLCLPIHDALPLEDVERIASSVRRSLA